MLCFLLSVKYKKLLLSLNDCKQFDPDYHNTGILVFFMARVLITTTAICFSSYVEWVVFLTVVIQSDDGYNNDNDENRISGGIA